MGRRRRRVVRIVKKKLPTVFVCPRCGEEAVRVTIAKDTGHAVVLCALCNLRDEFPAHPAAQAIDVYSYFTDRFYGVKDPRPIIPHDRDFPHVLPEDDSGGEPEALENNDAKTESPVVETLPEKLEPEPRPLVTSEPASPLESENQTTDPLVSKADTTEAQTSTVQTGVEEGVAKTEKDSQDESEPFADILENKDKKRYSSTPLPQQTSEQTS